MPHDDKMNGLPTCEVETGLQVVSFSGIVKCKICKAKPNLSVRGSFMCIDNFPSMSESELTFHLCSRNTSLLTTYLRSFRYV